MSLSARRWLERDHTLTPRLKTYSSQMENEGQQGWVTWRVCMDGLEATMDRIGYERERGVERGDQVRDESEALLVANNR